MNGKLDGKSDFDTVMRALAAAGSPAPQVQVDVKRILAAAESARPPVLWRDFAIASALAAAAMLVLTFTLEFTAVEDAGDPVSEVYQECESTFALYSYSNAFSKY